MSGRSSTVASDVTPRLHEELGSDEIEKLYQIFTNLQKLEPHQLREALRNLGIAFTDEQFKTLFLKVLKTIVYFNKNVNKYNIAMTYVY